jgi:hypothetical protein
MLPGGVCPLRNNLKKYCGKLALPRGTPVATPTTAFKQVVSCEEDAR